MFRTMFAFVAAAGALMATPLLAGEFPVQRCVNLSNFLEVPRDDRWDYEFEAAHIDLIAEAGFDTLRLPVRVGDWWQYGGLDPRFRHLMVDLVERARAAGLTVILDLHHYERFIEDPQMYGDQFVGIWVALAELFPPDAGLVFELLNEPEPNNMTAEMLPYYARALHSIRKRHPDAWVIYGGTNWNSLDEMLKLPADPNPRVVHTFHYYLPVEFTHQQADWHPNPMPEANWGTEAERSRVASDFAKAGAHHMPVFLGEFGVYFRAPHEDRMAWLETVRRASDAEGIPWCHWGFGSGFGLFDTESGAWNTDALDALFSE